MPRPSTVRRAGRSTSRGEIGGERKRGPDGPRFSFPGDAELPPPKCLGRWEQDKGALRAPGILRRNSAGRVRFRWQHCRSSRKGDGGPPSYAPRAPYDGGPFARAGPYDASEPVGRRGHLALPAAGRRPLGLFRLLRDTPDRCRGVIADLPLERPREQRALGLR